MYHMYPPAAGRRPDRAGHKLSLIHILFKYIQSSNLEELGTLIVSVDLNGLMDSLNFNEGMYEDAQYYILADDRIIYNHTDLSESVRQGMEQIADGK